MSPDARQWRDEILLREASLADARRERDAGELSAEEFDAIDQREERALTRARAALEAFEMTQESLPATRRRRRSLLLVSFIAFVVALVILLVATYTLRQPGNSDTGSISLNQSQEVTRLLEQAQTDIANTNDAAALSAYEQVLGLDATNVTALTEVGWLDFSAGAHVQDSAMTTLGVSDLRQAIDLAPSLAAPRLYYAIAAASTPGNRALAISQFRVFLRLDPSAAQMAVAQPYLARYHLG